MLIISLVIEQKKAFDANSEISILSKCKFCWVCLPVQCYSPTYTHISIALTKDLTNISWFSGGQWKTVLNPDVPGSLWNNLLDECTKIICGKLPLHYVTVSSAFSSVSLAWLWYNFPVYYFYYLQSLFNADVACIFWGMKQATRGKKKRMFFLEIVGIYIYILLSFKEAQSVLLASDNSGLYLSPYLWLFHF